jgi:dienelactone hydrolase
VVFYALIGREKRRRMSTPFTIQNPSGDTIRGDIHLAGKGKGPFPVLIVCHGFKGFKDWGFFPYLCDRLADAGTAAVRFNFSHAGVGEDLLNFTELDKFAVNTVGKEMEDLRAVLDAVADKSLPESKNFDTGRIGILGHSRGAAATLLVGGRDPRVKTLLTWAGISTTDRYSEAEKEVWRKSGEIVIHNSRTGQAMPIKGSVLEDLDAHREEYDITAAVKALKVPFLVIHGDEDETVPFYEASLLHDQTPRGLRSLQIVPGGGHTFGAVHPFAGTTEELDEAIRVTLEWVSSRL